MQNDLDGPGLYPLFRDEQTRLSILVMMTIAINYY